MSEIKLICGDALEELKKMENESIDCVITSPPYWGLRDYGIYGQLGLEKTPEEYVAKMVEVFKEVKRVLKKEGTLWLNLGDSYMSLGENRHKGWKDPKNNARGLEISEPQGLRHPIKKPKDLVGIPWMIAFALQSGGWYLRQDIIWHKPNPMPESVTDRCTKSHEYIFLLAKSQKYYFDNEAIKERGIPQENRPHGIIRDRLFDYDNKERVLRNRNKDQRKTGGLENSKGDIHKTGTRTGKNLSDAYSDVDWDKIGRNKRSVWTVTTKPFKGAHFAVFPEDLILPCVLAGCPQFVCKKCGKARKKILDKGKLVNVSHCKTTPTGSVLGSKYDGRKEGSARFNDNKFISGWRYENNCIGYTDCGCNVGFESGTILDPFCGAGTTGVVAKKLNRNFIGIDLNPKYIEMAQRRIDNTQGSLF